MTKAHLDPLTTLRSLKKGQFNFESSPIKEPSENAMIAELDPHKIMLSHKRAKFLCFFIRIIPKFFVPGVAWDLSAQRGHSASFAGSMLGTAQCSAQIHLQHKNKHLKGCHLFFLSMQRIFHHIDCSQSWELEREDYAKSVKRIGEVERKIKTLPKLPTLTLGF